MRVDRRMYTRDEGWCVPLSALETSAQPLILVFGASSYLDTPEPLRELRACFPSAIMAGCSSAGEILQRRIYDEALVVSFVHFERTAVRAAWASVASAEGSRAAGEALGAALAGDGLRSVLVLSDGLAVNGTELVRGLNACIGSGVVVTGGLAGDGARFARTWVLDEEGAPTQGRVCALGLYGDALEIGHGSRGGWDAFGAERRVTRAEGNVLYELDRRPALALYKEYLGDRASGLPATGLLFPLVLLGDDDAEREVVRTILAVDEAAQSLTFAGDIPEGSRVQLMRANFDRLVDGAADAAVSCALEGGPLLAIAVSCVGRRLVLGERAEEEVEATLDAFPAESTQIGFYSYGELSPVGLGSCDLHNQTMTLTTWREQV